MKRHWLVLAGGIGALTLVASVGQVAAGAAGKPHSDQVITVTKTAAGSGAPLGGAVFTLYKWHGTCDFSSVVATATSNSAGVATFNLEGHHNYCVVETTPPAGYLLPTTGPVVVKTAHSTNSKGTDDPANVKESATVAFVDTAQAVAPTATTTTTTTPTTPTTTATPATPATP
ncbi:MAG TPA: prealbumin-like fold domain-containing protein, partial [Acidimicrobiales bacterium]|nr:prealbumin-like fold domain-containing protein [Acidimicrobiales bacterium]